MQPNNIIPKPIKIVNLDSEFILSEEVGIIIGDETISATASLLVRSVAALTGLHLKISGVDKKNKSIHLVHDNSLGEEEYCLEIKNTGILISGKDNLALSHGVASLVQLIIFHDRKIILPCLNIQDRPASPFRALMIDLARYKHSVATLKQLIVMCWWYKIRYLQLHLTDIQAFTFPSTTFPELASAHNSFSLGELKDLENFANDHGVTIIPELDLPGHANSALRTLCPTEPHNDWNVLNPVHKDTMRVLDTLIGEMCDVFKSTPYFHIGGDEVVYDGWKDCPIIRQYMKTKSIDDFPGLLNFFLAETNKLVKQHHKRTIAWEGFKLHNKIRVPADIIVQRAENYEQPEDLIACGHEIINASWGPLYVTDNHSCPTEMIYQWNPCIFGSYLLRTAGNALDKTPELSDIADVMTVYPEKIDVNNPPYVKAIPHHKNLLGAMLCSWQQPDCVELATLRRRIAAMSERTWNHACRGEFSLFLQKLEHQDEYLERLLEDVLQRHTNTFILISRALEIAARQQAGQEIGCGPTTSKEVMGV